MVEPMTTLLDRPAAAPGPQPTASKGDLAARYAARAGRRRLATDALVVAGWLVVAIPVAVWLGEGGWSAMRAAPGDFVTGLGILAGLAGTASMVVMLWLAARVPAIDRTIGHDRALALHSDLGQVTFGALLLHGVLVVSGYALGDGLTWPGEFATLWATRDFVLAVLGIVALTAVAVSSVVAARRRLSHEVWHGIHLLTYAAVLVSLPHQFSMGGLFADGPASWFWAGLWAATLFVVLTFRVFAPAFTSLEHRFVVRRVVRETRDTVSIEMTGRRVDRLGLRAGQFLHWRFLAPGLWWHQHPFSVSAAPHGDTVRITVRELGAGTTRLARTLRPGTPVFVEGPYGLFTEAARTAPDVVLAGIGIGVAPVRALLEETGFAPGHATVVLRARDAADIAHLAEFEAWCAARGARLEVLTGRRGGGSWLPAAESGRSLADLAGDLGDADVFVCGPQAATDLVVADALACGVPRERIHHERFAW